jgi:hypothetical protein
MSAQFFVTYHGVPIRFNGGESFTSVASHVASSFISEADAWYAAYQAGLMPQFTDVESANDSRAVTSAATEGAR